MFNRKFPYTDMHDLNLDWVMRKVKEMAASVQNISSSISNVTAAYLQEHLPEMLGDSLDDFCNSVNASLTEQAEDISALQTAVANIQGGTAIPVTSASAMIDTTAIYLYMGSETGYNYGDWYYYDGTSWVDGGTYGTGTISNNARNILIAILRNAVFDGVNMTTYINALETALKANGTPEEPQVYTIYYLLTDVTSDTETTQIGEGASFTCTLSIEEGYAFETVTITMGGTDITSTAYDATTHVVTIASVVGDVEIIATAEDTTAPLYQLASPTSAATNTGIALLATDMDYTVCCKWETLVDAASYNPFGITAANNSSLRVYCLSNAPARLYWQPQGNVQITNSVWPGQKAGNYVYLVLRHTAGSEEVVWNSYAHNVAGTQQTRSGTFSGSYAANSNNMYVVHDGASKVQVNDFAIYKYVWSDDQVTAYLTE